MARTKEGALLTNLHRRQQLALRAEVVKAVANLFPMWQPRDPASFARFADAMVLVAQNGGRRSSAIAAAYYQLFRSVDASGDAARISPVVILAPPPPEEQVRASVSATARAGVYRAFGAGLSYEEAMANGLVEVSGAVSRLALDSGRDTIVESAQSDPSAVGWARVTGDNPCAFCAMLASRGPVYKEDTVGFEAHDHCVPAGTLVNGPSTEYGFRRWYEGKVVVIGMADGHELTITPNHPVLTQRGWVAAGLIEVGDQVAQRSRSQRDTLLVPNEQHVPSPIEDVWGALRVDGLVSVPVATEDFHGDGLGSKSKVDIVAADCLFADERDVALCECGCQVVGAVARTASVADPLASVGDATLVEFGIRLAATRLVSGRGIRDVFLSRQGLSVQDGSLAHASALDACLAQPARHDISRHGVADGERLLRNAGDVVGNEIVGRGSEHTGRPVATWPRFDPPAGQGEAGALRTHAQLGGDLLERLAGGVELGSIGHLRRIEYAGHVYNLQTAEGWYEADTVIVSNCSCGAEPAYEGSEWPGRAQEFRDLWDEEGGSLNSFRQALSKR